MCDDEWSLQDADVACRQLGFQGARRAYGSAYFGAGEGPIWLDNLQCNTSESRLEDCPNKGLLVNDCTHNQDAGVECITTGNLALQYNLDVNTNIHCRLCMPSKWQCETQW